MKFKFKINKYYLAGHTILSPIKPFSEWSRLEKKLWQKYKNESAYYLLNPKHINWAFEQMQINFLYNKIQSVFKKESKKLENIYKEIFKSKEFKRLYMETKKIFRFR